MWRPPQGQTDINLVADGNGDMVVDQLDYDLRRANFGSQLRAPRISASAAPEPRLMWQAIAVLQACYSAKSAALLSASQRHKSRGQEFEEVIERNGRAQAQLIEELSKNHCFFGTQKHSIDDEVSVVEILLRRVAMKKRCF